MIHALVEIKTKTGDNWNRLLEEMWYQANVAKSNKGRLRAIKKV